MRRLRSMIYRLGFRPHYTSIWYSPSLSWFYYDVDLERRRLSDDKQP